MYEMIVTQSYSRSTLQPYDDGHCPCISIGRHGEAGAIAMGMCRQHAGPAFGAVRVDVRVAC